jgi:NADH-quinone oxidoreductase subunit G
VHRQLGVTPGALVKIRAGDDAERSDAEERRL